MNDTRNDQPGEGRFIGIIEPVLGEWNWKFHLMEVGDWFLVAHDKRDPEKVRGLASVRGSQLKKGFQVTKHDKDHPGYTKVTCAPYLAGRAKTATPLKVLSYGDAREVVMNRFGLYLDQIGKLAQMQDITDRQGNVIEGIKEVIVEPLFVEGGERITFDMLDFTVGVEVAGDKLRFVKLPKGWTVKVWEKMIEQELAAIMD